MPRWAQAAEKAGLEPCRGFSGARHSPEGLERRGRRLGSSCCWAGMVAQMTTGREGEGRIALTFMNEILVLLTPPLLAILLLAAAPPPEKGERRQRSLLRWRSGGPHLGEDAAQLRSASPPSASWREYHVGHRRRRKAGLEPSRGFSGARHSTRSTARAGTPRAANWWS